MNTPQDTSETDAFTRAFDLVTLLVIVMALGAAVSRRPATTRVADLVRDE